METKSLPKLIRGRRKAIIAALVGVLVLIGAALWLICYEPSYDGTRLSGWLTEFQSEKVERRLAAAAAIKHIGPQAVPYLVKRLEAEPARERSTISPRRVRVLEWLATHTPLKITFVRNLSTRLQALAALDALGAEGKDALPILEKLVERHPEEPDLVFAVARLGEAGMPLLKRSLTNSAPHDSDTLRLAARACLQMMDSHSYVLYPELAPGVPMSEYLARCGQFHLAMTQTALADYRRQRFPTVSPVDTPSTSTLPPSGP